MKTQKYGPFSGPKKCFWVVFFWFSSPELILAGETCQKPHSILSIWAPRALFVIYTPHIWSHHPVLDSHVQITRKYSTAMCSMCSCSDQRSQNKLLWSMKGIESLRIQSFKGFCKSRKILGLDENPGIGIMKKSQDIPGSRRSVVMNGGPLSLKGSFF